MNDCLQAVEEELTKAGVRFTVDHTHKHIHIRYGESLEHLHVVGKTPSDHRAHLNERALIRRHLRQQGYIQEDTEAVISSDVAIHLHDGEPTCFSYDLADRFGKSHKDVLRAIDNAVETIKDDEFKQRNFAPFDFLDDKNRKMRAYRLTEEGFSIVALGFTGASAMTWKVKYVKAFKSMRNELQRIGANNDSLIRQELDALTDMLAECESKIASLSPPMQARKAQFVRPSILRRQKREMRAGH